MKIHCYEKMTTSSSLEEEDVCETKPEEKSSKQYHIEIVWSSVAFLALVHLILLAGVYSLITNFYWKSFIFQVVYGAMGGLGITAGSHRLWCHRSYKARLPLRILLAGLVCIAAETDIYAWCRDHRVHHKFSETNADPHNIKRGFFFAHMGWLMCRKHPKVTSKGKTVDLDDLMQDPVVRIQRRFHTPLSLFFSLLLPVSIEHFALGCGLWCAISHSFFRYALNLHSTWFVNSAAHLIGNRPFDVKMAASEVPWVAVLALGEGWHNYHHVFPYDYSASELGYTLNFTKFFIDLMAWFGLAYKRKTVPKEKVLIRKLTTGDGTRLG